MSSELKNCFPYLSTDCKCVWKAKQQKNSVKCVRRVSLEYWLWCWAIAGHIFGTGLCAMQAISALIYWWVLQFYCTSEPKLETILSETMGRTKWNNETMHLFIDRLIQWFVINDLSPVHKRWNANSCCHWWTQHTIRDKH